MLKSPITKYLPDTRHQKVCVINTRVTSDMYEMIRRISNQNGWDTSKVIRACLMQLIKDHTKSHEQSQEQFFL